MQHMYVEFGTHKLDPTEYKKILQEEDLKLYRIYVDNCQQIIQLRYCLEEVRSLVTT